jgi:hypothetical protein
LLFSIYRGPVFSKKSAKFEIKIQNIFVKKHGGRIMVKWKNTNNTKNKKLNLLGLGEINISYTRK